MTRIPKEFLESQIANMQHLMAIEKTKVDPDDHPRRLALEVAEIVQVPSLRFIWNYSGDDNENVSLKDAAMTLVGSYGAAMAQVVAGVTPEHRDEAMAELVGMFSNGLMQALRFLDQGPHEDGGGFVEAEIEYTRHSTKPTKLN